MKLIRQLYALTASLSMLVGTLQGSGGLGAKFKDPLGRL